MKKKTLAMMLSSLETVHSSASLEQYTLSGDVAADILIYAYDFEDVCSRAVADLGCGSGILGIGALLLGAAGVTFVDCDSRAIEMARTNLITATKDLKVGKIIFECGNIQNITLTADTVVQNPPFGTKRKGADVQFLKKATEIAPVVYSLHKKGNAGFLSQQTHHTLTHVKDMTLPLYRNYPFHTKRVVNVEAELLRFEKVKI
ncbi:MAG: methyltransferase [Theionarchaea archaeon]|nr:methyltransferase [Theionarchaea archaeon]MBU7037695.1 methyltransferase [Theionarchaea archaeon]